MRILSLIVGCSLFLACEKPKEPEQELEKKPQAVLQPSTAPSKLKIAFQPTKTLISDPEVAALVDNLATFERVESSHVGAAGMPSKTYAAFEALQTKASPEQFTALLFHENPVVRGYVSKGIIRTYPEKIPLLYPLIEDTTKVESLQNCDGDNSSIAYLIAETLCWSSAKDAAKQEIFTKEASLFFLKAAKDRSTIADYSLRCALKINLEETIKIANEWLNDPGLDEDAQSAVIQVLAQSQTPGSCQTIIAQTQKASLKVRREIADNLWRCTSEEAHTMLEAMSNDPDRTIASTARASYLKQTYLWRSKEPLDQVEELFDDIRTGARPATDKANEFAKQDTTKAMAFLELYGLSHSPHSEVFLSLLDGPKTEPVTQMVRRLAPQLPPKDYFQSEGARIGVVAYLASLQDPIDLPEMRRSLRSKNSKEFDYAVSAVVKLKDKESIPILESIYKAKGDFSARAKSALDSL